MPRLEFLLKLIPSCVSSSSSSSSTSESTTSVLPLEVVIFRVHVIVDSFRDFLKVCRKSRVGGGWRLNLRVNNQQVGSGVFFFPPIEDPHNVNQTIEDPHAVNNQSLNIINNQVLHVVNNQTLHFVNNQVLPVVNNQTLHVINNQVLPVVNSQVLPVVNNQTLHVVNNQVLPVVNNQVLPVVNNQTLHVVNNQVLPVVNSQVLPVVNNQTLHVVNNQVHPVVNNQVLPVVNNQVLPVVNNQVLSVVNNQTLPVVNNQVLHVDNNQVLHVVNNQTLPVVNNQVLHVVNNEPPKNDNNNQVLPVVNNQVLPIVNNEPPKNDNNNQVLPVVNNQVHPVVNNQVHPVVNNQVLPVVNNQVLPVVNNQVLPLVNNQVLPVVNNQVLPVVNNQVLPLVDNQVLPVVNNQVLPLVNNQVLPLVNNQVHPVVNNLILPPTNTQLLPLINPQSPKKEIQEPNLVRSVRSSLNSINGVLLCKEGVGGTYQVVNDQQQPIAIFKPVDEEPGSPNNPKKNFDKPLLPPGGGACREVAAFLLDHNFRAGVPETYMVHGMHHERFSYPDCIFPKTGSLQKFVQNIGNSLSMSSSRFTVEDVHNIGILDLRLLNLDRNGENLLIRKEGDGYRLVPIDHAYTLPDKLDNVWVEWLHWRQAKVPFSPDVMEFVDTLDPESDARILSGIGISPECIRNMKLATCLLKKGVSAGLTLFEIASMICRKKQSEESELEKAVARAWNHFPTEFDRNGSPKEFEGRFEEIVCEVVEKRKNEVKVPF